jgi:hypothetical protein
MEQSALAIFPFLESRKNSTFTWIGEVTHHNKPATVEAIHIVCINFFGTQTKKQQQFWTEILPNIQ